MYPYLECLRRCKAGCSRAGGRVKDASHQDFKWANRVPTSQKLRGILKLANRGIIDLVPRFDRPLSRFQGSLEVRASWQS